MNLEEGKGHNYVPVGVSILTPAAPDEATIRPFTACMENIRTAGT